MLCIVLFVGTMHAFLPDIGRDLVSLGFLSSMAFLTLTALLTARYPGGANLAAALGMRSSYLLAIPLGMLIGIGARGPAEGLQRLSVRLMPVSEESQATVAELMKVHSGTHGVFLAVVMALLVPLGEEIFYRGGVYGALRRGRMSALQATLVTSLGFTLSHPQALFPIGFLALIFGFLRATSGSLLPALGAHMTFNAVEVLAMTTDLVPEATPWIIQGSTVGVLVLLGASFLLAMNSRVAHENRRADSGAPGGRLDDV